MTDGVSIIFSKHAQKKLEERRLDQALVEKVLRQPNFIFYDLLSKTVIAIAEVQIAGLHTNLIVPYIEENEMLKVVTVHPCKDIARQIKKKEGVRWVRIR